MQLEVLAIGVATKQFCGGLGYPGPHRHQVEGNDVRLAIGLIAFLRLEEVRKAQPAVTALAREGESHPLAAHRLRVRARLMVKDHEVVSFAVAREVAVHDRSLQQTLGLDPLEPHAQPRPPFGLDQLLVRRTVLAALAFKAPLPQERRALVEVGRVVGQRDALDHPAAPERRLGDAVVLGNVRTLRVGGSVIIGRGHHRTNPALAQLGEGVRDAELWVGTGDRHRIHQAQALEGVSGVTDLTLVDLSQVVLDIGAGQGCAPEQHGPAAGVPAGVELLEVLLHDNRRLHQQATHADGVGAVLLGCANNLGDGLFDAYVDDLVPVVGQDDVHQVLADVVDVPAHRRQHDTCLGFTRGAVSIALDKRLEIGDGGLHNLGRLQYERELHLAPTEQLADSPHAFEQVVVDDVQSAETLVERGLKVRLEALALAVDDAPAQSFLQRQSGELVRASLLQRGLVHALEQLEQAAQRVVGQLAAPRLTSPDTLVVDEVEGHLALLGGDPRDGHDPSGVHDGRVEPSLDTLVQKHRVQDHTDGWLETERHVRDAQGCLNLGIATLDLADGLNGLQAIAAGLLLTCGDREGQRVHDDVLDVHAPLTRERRDEPGGHSHLVFTGSGLAGLVDGQCDDSSAVLLDHRHDPREPRTRPLAVPVVDGVDDRTATQQLEAGLENSRFGGVQDQRKGARGGEPADDLVHVLHPVTADVVDTDVKQVGAVLGLVTGDLYALCLL